MIIHKKFRTLSEMRKWCKGKQRIDIINVETLRMGDLGPMPGIVVWYWIEE